MTWCPSEHTSLHLQHRVSCWLTQLQPHCLFLRQHTLAQLGIHGPEVSSVDGDYSPERSAGVTGGFVLAVTLAFFSSESCYLASQVYPSSHNTQERIVLGFLGSTRKDCLRKQSDFPPTSVLHFEHFCMSNPIILFGWPVL